MNFEHINFWKSGQPWDNPPVNRREEVCISHLDVNQSNKFMFMSLFSPGPMETTGDSSQTAPCCGWTRPEMNSKTIYVTIRKETITNGNLEILFCFRFCNGRTTKFLQIFFRICFHNDHVGHAQATTAGHTDRIN